MESRKIELLNKYNELYKSQFENTNLVGDNFLEFSTQLSKLNFNDSAIELSNKFIKFTLSFEEGFLLMVTKNLEDKNNKNEIIFTLFENRKLILSNITTLPILVEGISNFLEKTR